MDQLEGKTAVVTGAASGMGKAFAERFARAGMNVVLTDVEEPALDQAVTDVGALTDVAPGSTEAIGVVVDVSDEDAVTRLAGEAIDRFGRVNVVCNNAGVAGSDIRTGQIDTKQWKWVLDVNLWGVVHGHQAFLPHLLEHGDGHIVNTASMAGHWPGHSAYTASKWAVVGITEGLYHQLQAMGSTVGVSCLCPGWVNTRIADSARNQPEWAAPDALQEPSPEVEQAMAEVRENLSAGMPPAEVADLVHDAIVGNRFWVFTDLAMVQSLESRYRSVLDNENPPSFSLRD